MNQQVDRDKPVVSTSRRVVVAILVASAGLFVLLGVYAAPQIGITFWVAAPIACIAAAIVLLSVPKHSEPQEQPSQRAS